MKTAATMRKASLAYLAKQRESGIVLSAPPTGNEPGIRLHDAIEKANRLVGDVPVRTMRRIR
jgi:hypothetical protein